MSRIRYIVPMVRQETSPVCWLACAIMLMQRNNRSSVSENAFNYLYGDPRMGSMLNVNSQTTIQNTLLGLGFRVRRLSQVHVNTDFTFNEPGRNTTEPDYMYWSSRERNMEARVIYAILSNFGPFILFHRCGRFWYGRNHNEQVTGRHAVLITGIDLDSKTCWFNNPWGEINVPTSLRSIIGAIHDWESNPSSPSVAYLV